MKYLPQTTLFVLAVFLSLSGLIGQDTLVVNPGFGTLEAAIAKNKGDKIYK
ncbi:MAG: hypothetical protein IH594_07810, partial [Bacteroidales bacterium]|nr:hypothetical protein [Bacteroidales bacterium]